MKALGTFFPAPALTEALLVGVRGGAHAAPAADYGKAAQKATNARRAGHDLRTLRPDACLKRMAARHAARLAREEALYHQDLSVVMRRCDLRAAGENVAYGYPTGRAVVNRGWMRSPGHRANILEPRYRRGVVAARRSDDGTWYAVQLFGRR